MGISYPVRFDVDDGELSRQHALAFGHAPSDVPWRRRLERYSVTWVGAFDGKHLVGFVHAVADGGQHAFLLDTIVHPDRRREGIGRELVAHAAEDAARSGCTWLHVDYEPHLTSFYVNACGFRPTKAALLRLQPGP